MKKMDSPLDAYKNGGGTPYKMKGHTLPGIKQNKEAKTMLAASAPFQQKTIHGKLTKKIEHKRPQAHGELRKFIAAGTKEGTTEMMQTGLGGAKKGTKKRPKKYKHVENKKRRDILRTGGIDYSKTLKDTFKKAYKKLKSMKLGGGKLAR